MDPSVARRTWRTVEPIHAVGYFAPETAEALTALGFPNPALDGYFASRAAPMGAVAAEVVIATFFNFNPDLVHRAIPAAWTVAEPSVIWDTRVAAVDRTLHRLLGDAVGSPEMREAATLARRAAEAAAELPEGRPLFAAYTGLEWPDAPHLVLWHAQTLLREFRGDGHIAALTVAGMSGCEALVVHGATGEVPPELLRSTRGWLEDVWGIAAERLRSSGWLDPDGNLTESGRLHRAMVEQQTDEAALPAYEALGEDGCERLRHLARPWSKTIVSSSSFGLPGAAG